MRTRLLWVLVPLAVLPASGCKEDAPQAPAQRAKTQAETTERPTREALLAEWATGPFTKVRASDVRSKVDQRLRVDDEVGLSTEALDALHATLASFLAAYASTDFEKYLLFRDPETLAGKDHPSVRERIEAVTQNWNTTWGDPPTDGVGVMRFTWRMYIEGEFLGSGGGAVIERVNWNTCRVRVDTIKAGDIVPSEWDQQVGTESHFHRTLMGSRIESAVYGELETPVPNHVSADTIAKRDGKLVYADFDIVLKTNGMPPHPILLRLIYDRQSCRWLPLNAFKIINEPPRVFIW